MSRFVEELRRMDRETLEKMQAEIAKVLSGEPRRFGLAASEDVVPELELHQLLRVVDLDRDAGRVTVEVFEP